VKGVQEERLRGKEHKTETSNETTSENRPDQNQAKSFLKASDLEQQTGRKREMPTKKRTHQRGKTRDFSSRWVNRCVTKKGELQNRGGGGDNTLSSNKPTVIKVRRMARRGRSKTGKYKDPQSSGRLERQRKAFGLRVAIRQSGGGYPKMKTQSKTVFLRG